MKCLKLPIPPLPLLLTVGHSTWMPGQRHFERTFPVFDILFVRSGTHYMTEDGVPYEIKENEFLILEPGRKHWGHQACTEPTELYWLHFRHDAAYETVDHRSIPWSSVLRQGTDHDLAPVEQYMYMPKYAAVDMMAAVPVLEEMVALRAGLCHENALQLHAQLGKLLALLQGGLRQRQSSRSSLICEQVKQYVQARYAEPFHADWMAAELHFDFDYAARCLKKHTGMSPLQYHHYVRMEEAKRMLHHTVLPVQEIASVVGFADYNYFIRMFRKTVGVTPGAFRDRYRGLI